jgi:RND family efflux transporter MFP subunit
MKYAFPLPTAADVSSGAKRGAAAAVLLATLFLTGPTLAQKAPDPPSVGVAQVQKVWIAPKVAMPGTVVSLNDAQLASEVEGRISWVANVGVVVKENDVVARIDNRLASLQLASDRANVNRLAAQVKYDRSQAARMENLLSQNAIAKSARDQAVSTRDMDAGALAQAQAAMDKSEYELKHSDIRAPFPGRVVARLINPGEYATAGKAIVRLVDISSTEVSVQTPIDEARYLREGMPLTVDIEGKPVIAKVRAIVPVGDVASRSIEVRLTLPASAGFVGDAAKVYIPSAEPRDVVAVPRDALVLREDNTYIFKVDGKSKAERIAVETGAEEGAMVEVRGLIAPGERVIVRGAERLEAGQIVKPAMAS